MMKIDTVTSLLKDIIVQENINPKSCAQFCLTSGSSEVVEDIWPGRVVKEEGGSVSVWYRYGNKLVKQASKGKTPAHTVTREFTGTEMITSLSTDNNALKVRFSESTNITIKIHNITGICCSYKNYLSLSPRIYLTGSM